MIGWYFNQTTCPSNSPFHPSFIPLFKTKKKNYKKKDCTKQTSCNGCNQTPSCVWCTNDQTCRGANDIGSECLIDHQCDCRTHQHCQRCLGDTKCTWCPERNTCEDKSATTCDKPVNTCPSCNMMIDCEQCNGQWGCNWCVQNGTGSCEQTSQCAGSNQVAQCTSVCNTLTDCGYCSRASGCGWCEATASCYGGDSKDTSCLLTHTCKYNSGGFRASSFVGGMFLMIGLGLVGFVVFMVYRNYNSKREGYEFHNNL